MFARQQRNGWDQYGNEVKMVELTLSILYVIIAFGFVIWLLRKWNDEVFK